MLHHQSMTHEVQETNNELPGGKLMIILVGSGQVMDTPRDDGSTSLREML